jgi:hypothetical protein
VLALSLPVLAYADPPACCVLTSVMVRCCLASQRSHAVEEGADVVARLRARGALARRLEPARRAAARESLELQLLRQCCSVWCWTFLESTWSLHTTLASGSCLLLAQSCLFFWYLAESSYANVAKLLQAGFLEVCCSLACICPCFVVVLSCWDSR